MSSAKEEKSDHSIFGVWYEDDSETIRGTLRLRRESPAPFNWGQKYDFQENGKLIDAYSAPCGNDLGIHSWSGKWVLHRERNLLLMQIEKVDHAGYESTPCNPPEDYKNGREYEIIELTEQNMILKRVQSQV
jgi:hypothetical protein